MKSYAEIMTLEQEAKTELDAREKEYNAAHYGTPEKERARMRVDIMKTYLAILHDNKRRAYVAEKMPLILAAVNRFAGKPCGEKTREKIDRETKATAGCSVYLHDGGAYSSDDLNIVDLDEQGYASWIFKHDGLKLYVRRKDREKGRLFNGNKIIPLQLGDFELYNCAEYNPEPMKTAVEIVEKFADLQNAFKAYEKTYCEYNKMIPSSMESVYTPAPRWYMF